MHQAKVLYLSVKCQVIRRIRTNKMKENKWRITFSRGHLTHQKFKTFAWYIYSL